MRAVYFLMGNLIGAGLLLAAPSSAFAQEENLIPRYDKIPPKLEAGQEPEIEQTPPAHVVPQATQGDVGIGAGITQEPPQNQMPIDPVFPPVKHLMFDWPVGMTARIESLLHGISMDMPPEYDHYGYEIRRYMVSVVSIKVMGSADSIRGQLTNIENAQNVLKTWDETFKARYAEIERQMDVENASPTVRTAYKYNQGVVKAFMVEAATWMKNNRAVLEFLQSIGPERYRIEGTQFTFKNEQDLNKFISLYDARERALAHVTKYTPFKMMTY